jgi:hypothetical protein
MYCNNYKEATALEFEIAAGKFNVDKLWRNGN